MNVYIAVNNCNMDKRLKIYPGQRFNDLTVVKEMDSKKLPSGQTNRVFLMRCKCGKEKEIRLVHFVRGRIKSCGCAMAGKTGTGVYDEKRERIAKVWRQMNNRCSEGWIESHLYYDKGISVCDRWANDFWEFHKWALANGYKKGLHIDRIDNSKGYFPENCRWVTPMENANNRDNTMFVNYNDRKVAFQNLIREKGLEKNKAAILGRLERGWSVEEAFDKPIRKGNYNRTH